MGWLPCFRPLLWKQAGGLWRGQASAVVQGKVIGAGRSEDSRNAEGTNLRAAEEGPAPFPGEKVKNHREICRTHQTFFIPHSSYPCLVYSTIYKKIFP